MKIRILAIGKLKEKYWKDAVAEYEKRLGPYTKLEILEGPEVNAPADIGEKERLRLLMDRILAGWKNKALLYEQKLKGLSPYETLRSGYAFVTDESGNRVRSIKGLLAGQALNVRFEDGSANVIVRETKPAEI